MTRAATKGPGHHVAAWLAAPRVEGPITPDDAEILAELLMWDGEYVRARELVDNLISFHAADRPIAFGRLLGIRSALAAIISNERTAARQRAARRNLKPAERPVSRKCGSQGVDESGHCVRCGLVPDGPELDADAAECPRGFLDPVLAEREPALMTGGGS